jgi:putative membrane protein insertion efficiency factor
MTTLVLDSFGRVARGGFGLRAFFLFLVRAYRKVVSPALPRTCRFEPSCAAYAEEALRRHHIAKALWLTVRRIARCHPFHPGGYDPVP